MTRALVLLGLLATGSALAADAPDFLFSPVPRWASEAEVPMETVCEAMRRECPALARLPEIATTVAYDELYDASGNLAGLRMTRGTGCAPLDESILVSQRAFRADFHRPERPDLGDIRLELQPGIDPNAVRIVKSVDLQYGSSCAQ